jgi:carbon-monoxide dehydrogenase large subunit
MPSQTYRVEDFSFLTGKAKFIADIRLDRMASLVIVRSTEANASIRSIDSNDAAALDRVVAVVTSSDLNGKVLPLTRKFYSLAREFIDNAAVIEGGYQEEILSVGDVSRVGEPVLAIVAEDRFAAEDARDLVTIEYDVRESIINPENAMKPDSPLVATNTNSNIHSSCRVVVGDVENAEKNSNFRISRRFRFGRSVGSPIENRGVMAQWDAAAEKLTVWSTTQIPHFLKANLSQCLLLPEQDIEVRVPSMGGSFGGGIYTEEILVAHLARELCRPIQWLEERSEAISNSRHSRDVTIDATVSCSSTGRINSLRLKVLLDAGAHNPFGITLVHNVASHARSIYKIENLLVEGFAVHTNKTRNTPVRGAGRPEATFVIDRLIDVIANRLGRDPAELRMMNIISPREMPYKLGMRYRDGSEAVYDSGDFQSQFERLLQESGYETWRKFQAEARKEGRFIGIGLSCHVEATGIGPHEGATVRVEKDGGITVFSGAQPHGQSHHHVLSKIVAAELNVEISKINVVTGNTSLLPFGTGTFGSRSAITAGSSSKMAAIALREKIFGVASEYLEADVADLETADGVVFVRGTPARSMTFSQIYGSCSPASKYQQENGFVELSSTKYFVPGTVTYGSGSHCVVLEVFPFSGRVKFLDYVTVDDCGRALDSVVVDGQVIGGVIHGVSNALFEEVIYDEQGQLLNPSLVDYLLASSTESPRVRVFHENHQTNLNPLGIKGIGEGSTSSAPVAIANAISDALKSHNLEINKVPVYPWDIAVSDLNN